MRWTLLMVAAAGLMMIVLAGGCSQIVRQDEFHPCVDSQCPQCRGQKTYRCEQCLGRGNGPCHSCNGIGYVTCHDCGGDGTKKGQKCTACGTDGNPVGRQTCHHCDGTRIEKCPACGGRGMISCGTTTQHWVCRQCGTKYDYPASLCTKCGAK